MMTACLSFVSPPADASPASAPRGAALRVPGDRAAAGRRVARLPFTRPAALYRAVAP